MSSQVQPRILSGFMELLPEDQIRFNQMVDIIRAGYEKFGFLPLDTPTIELSEVLLAKAGGETEKQIYRFQRGDNDLSLRFDLTVPLARYVSQHAAELTFPFKRYQIGKVFRGERPQKGRFREFYQCDIDIIGSDELDIVYDAEMPAVIYHVFKELAFGAFTIHLNNSKLLNGFFAALGLEEQAAEVLRIIDKLAKIGEENVVKELQEMQLTSEAIDAILQLIHIAGSNDQILDSLQQMGIQHPLFRAGAEELAQVIQYMRLLGVPEEAFHIDLTIARGLDYYTGTVYETTLNEYPNLGSVCSGGRYDNLTGYYTKQKMPGIGISIGLTRLFSQLKEVQVLQAGRKSLAEVLVVPMGTQQLPEALKAAQQLRQADIKTDVYYQQKGMKQKMKYAARLGVPYTMLIGEEEAQQQLVALKGMQQGTQELLSIEEAIVKINKA